MSKPITRHIMLEKMATAMNTIFKMFTMIIQIGR